MRRMLAVVGVCVGLGGSAFATTDTGAGDLRGAIEESAQSMKAMKMTGDVDRDFVAAMQQHHRDTIEMARVQVKHGKDPSMRALAREIIDKQKHDLDTLEQWMWLRQVSDRQK